jgi:Protein of unknown function (DUF4239)
MSPMAISWIVFGVLVGAALVGMALRALLPEHHLSQDSKDVVKLGMGLIGTMAALVLGLLIASAKSSFDAQRTGLAQLSANLILLDRILAHYGPEAKDCRTQLRETVTAMLDQIWPENRDRAGQVEPTATSESLYERLQDLTPQTDAQRSLRAEALKTGVEVAHARWLLSAQKGSAIPVPFLVVLVFWLALLFASFSMFARPNATVVAVLVCCALSVAAAIFLILELDRPFDGLIQLSSDPLRRVFAQLGR